MIPKKPAPDLIRGGNRSSDKIMLKSKESRPCPGSIEFTGMPSSPSLFRPRTLDEALDILAGTPDARPISGGASLVAMMNAGLVEPAALVSLIRIPELSGIRRATDGGITVGAATRHSAIAADRVFDGTAAVLAHAASQIAGVAVRNMGTIGGAVAHADPGLDFPPALFAVDARVQLAAKSGHRALPIRDFFVDWYTTALEPGEIVISFEIPKPKSGAGLYLKHARVAGDFAIVSIALSLADDGEARVAVGGCGPAPLASTQADQMLSSGLTAETVRRAGELLMALANPVDDVRGTAEYRKLLIPRMLTRAVREITSARKAVA
jgi:carbon-monoxide dehydrogenase medium subunit